MLVTPSDMVTLVKPEQPENVPPPILVTPSGIVMLVKPVQSEKEEAAIVFVPFLTSYAPEIESLALIK